MSDATVAACRLVLERVVRRGGCCGCRADRAEMLDDAAACMAEREAKLRAALDKIREGFDRGIFVRSTEHDTAPAWAIKLLPYLAALAAAQEPDE